MFRGRAQESKNKPEYKNCGSSMSTWTFEYKYEYEYSENSRVELEHEYRVLQHWKEEVVRDKPDKHQGRYPSLGQKSINSAEPLRFKV